MPYSPIGRILGVTRKLTGQQAEDGSSTRPSPAGSSLDIRGPFSWTCYIFYRSFLDVLINRLLILTGTLRCRLTVHPPPPTILFFLVSTP